MVYFWLILAIFSELIATSLLKINATLPKTTPVILIGIVIFYTLSFFALGKTMATLPTGVTYAIWSGIGIVILTLIDIIIYRITFNWQSYCAIILIVIGVIMLNLNKS